MSPTRGLRLGGIDEARQEGLSCILFLPQEGPGKATMGQVIAPTLLS